MWECSDKGLGMLPKEVLEYHIIPYCNEFFSYKFCSNVYRYLVNIEYIKDLTNITKEDITQYKGIMESDDYFDNLEGLYFFQVYLSSVVEKDINQFDASLVEWFGKSVKSLIVHYVKNHYSKIKDDRKLLKIVGRLYQCFYLTHSLSKKMKNEKVILISEETEVLKVGLNLVFALLTIKQSKVIEFVYKEDLDGSSNYLSKKIRTICGIIQEMIIENNEFYHSHFDIIIKMFCVYFKKFSNEKKRNYCRFEKEILTFLVVVVEKIKDQEKDYKSGLFSIDLVIGFYNYLSCCFKNSLIVINKVTKIVQDTVDFEHLQLYMAMSSLYFLDQFTTEKTFGLKLKEYFLSLVDLVNEFILESTTSKTVINFTTYNIQCMIVKLIKSDECSFEMINLLYGLSRVRNQNYFRNSKIIAKYNGYDNHGLSLEDIFIIEMILKSQNTSSLIDYMSSLKNSVSLIFNLVETKRKYLRSNVVDKLIEMFINTVYHEKSIFKRESSFYEWFYKVIYVLKLSNHHPLQKNMLINQTCLIFQKMMKNITKKRTFRKFFIDNENIYKFFNIILNEVRDDVLLLSLRDHVSSEFKKNNNLRIMTKLQKLNATTLLSTIYGTSKKSKRNIRINSSYPFQIRKFLDESLVLYNKIIQKKNKRKIKSHCFQEEQFFSDEIIGDFLLM